MHKQLYTNDILKHILQRITHQIMTKITTDCFTTTKILFADGSRLIVLHKILES